MPNVSTTPVMDHICRIAARRHLHTYSRPDASTLTPPYAANQCASTAFLKRRNGKQHYNLGSGTPSKTCTERVKFHVPVSPASISYQTAFSFYFNHSRLLVTTLLLFIQSAAGCSVTLPPLRSSFFTFSSFDQLYHLLTRFRLPLKNITVIRP